MKTDPRKETSELRSLSRRDVLGLLGAAAAAPFARRVQGQPIQTLRSLPSCVVRPQQTEGPYFVDAKLLRSDIRSDPTDGSVKEGVPLRLVFRVSQIGDSVCAPLPGAVVDVWQFDAQGVYSAVRDFNGLFDTREKKFLRGHQVTDETGTARFTTIFPGWYRGRAVHIHFKIRTDPGVERGYEFTSQLYFDEAATDRVLAEAPYAANKMRRIKNAEDGIFRRGGDELMAALTEDDEGFAGSFDIGLELP